MKEAKAKKRPDFSSRVKRVNEKFYDEVESIEYDENAGVGFQSLKSIENILTAFGYISGRPPEFGKCLEVGCGSGKFIVNAAKNGLAKEAHALDLSKKMLAICRKNALANGVKISLQHGDMERLPYGNETFDSVVGISSLHHCPNTAKVLEENFRVLKPNGFIFYTSETPQKSGWLAKLTNAVWWLPRKLGLGSDERSKLDEYTKKFGAPVDVNPIIKSRLENMLLTAGFTDIRIRPVGLLSCAAQSLLWPLARRMRPLLPAYHFLLPVLLFIDLHFLARIVPFDYFVEVNVYASKGPKQAEKRKA